MTERAEDAVRAYYDRLRNDDPLADAFREGERTVKFGITESLFGSEAVRAALREQRETTADWHVESHDLRVEEYDDLARFADEVTMAWTDREGGARRRYDSRWSGVVERIDGEWLFVTMHVSAPPEDDG
ncbi:MULTISPECIES: AtzH-like domain-containing protein [Saliphagus]|uniref:AtzH-like domain-containing protein n=1 Tax=Saliphagus infecundisoli TaxID=1849069 RepID=A0ABD5QH30_9EURY|nr:MULTISPECIES: AtzH-like domain-containing protein [Saliphagus]